MLIYIILLSLYMSL